MRPPTVSGLVHVGLDVLATSVDPTTSKILAQTGNAIKGSTDANAVEWWQQAGICSRPSKPIAGKSAAQCVVLKTSDRDVAIASQDVRALTRYGNIGYGEVCIYAAGEDCTAQARLILKGDGSAAIFTTDTNTDDGKSVYFRVAPDGFSFVAPWGTIKFDATGFHILHSSGASFDLGGIYGLPAPLDQIASYIKLQAGTLNVSASAQSLGGAAPTPLALQVPTAASIAALQTEVAALQVECAAIAAALVAVCNIGGPIIPATHGAAAGAATAAVGVAAAVLVGGAASVAAAAPLMPATTSSS